MPFCTMVEWDTGFDVDLHDKLTAQAGPGLPAGCLSRIVGIVGTGAKVIEVWQSPDHAQRFAESSAPALASVEMPPPDRVSAFETTAYLTTPS